VSTCIGSLCTIALILALVFVLFAKTMVFLEADPNTFTVTQGLDYGYYPQETEFDKHMIAIGLSFKAEYQDQMDQVLQVSDFTDYLDSIADIEMFMQTKKDGKITKSEPLVLDPCSTLDLDKFYEPRKSS